MPYVLQVALAMVAFVVVVFLLLTLAFVALFFASVEYDDDDPDTDVDPLGELTDGDWSHPPAAIGLRPDGAHHRPALRGRSNVIALHRVPMGVARDSAIGQDQVSRRERVNGFGLR